MGQKCFPVAVAHVKGGQAKTTSVFFAAWELADLRYKVIWRDLDVDNPNLTDAFGDVGGTFDDMSVGGSPITSPLFPLACRYPLKLISN